MLHEQEQLQQQHEEEQARAHSSQGSSILLPDKQLAKRLDQADMDALCARYIPEKLLGEGTYGIVFKARSAATGAAYAIKKTRLEGHSEGIPATTIREVTLLHDLYYHPNVVRLLDVICTLNRVYLIFELLPEDLRQFIRRHRPSSGEKLFERSVLPLYLVKDITRQIVHALWSCHNNRILHRDLKPGNVLIATSQEGKGDRIKCTAKLADFGLARTYEMTVQTYTHEVMTLWYRSPEILLGDRHYTAAADVWSLGCIVAEMVIGYSLFRGDTTHSQLEKIFYAVGTPTESSWAGVTRLPGYDRSFKVYRVAALPTRLPDYNYSACEFIAFLLQTNPAARPTLAQVLEHPFLSTPDTEEVTPVEK